MGNLGGESEREEKARYEMKTDVKEVVSWKERLISDGEMISGRVLKIKQTF